MLGPAVLDPGVPLADVSPARGGRTGSRSVLIRFHIGTRWKSERRGHSAHALADEIHGSLGIEVDGVDISRGRLEDRLVPTTTALVESVARLLEGGARTAAVPFDEGSIELILARHGEAVTLSLVSLPRPARVLVRDLEVELGALAQAAGRCGEELLGHLAELPPDEAKGAAVGRLRQACTRLARASALPGEAPPPSGRPLSLRSRPPAGGTEAPSLGFDLRDEDGRLGSYEGGEGLHPLLAPGHLYVHAPDGEELCAVSGSPFLLLRDLADVGLRLLEAAREGDEGGFSFPLGWEAPAVEVDLRGGAVTVAGRTLRCPAEALARALFAGALDLGGALLARNPRLGHNPYLTSLVEEARERLSLCDQLAAPARAEGAVAARAPAPRSSREAPPLAPGALRRVSLRIAWTAEVGCNIRRLHPAGPSVWALGRRNAQALRLADGTPGPAIEGSVAVGGPKAPLLAADRAGVVSCSEADGTGRWTAALGADALSPAYAELPGGRAAVVADGTSLRLLGLERGDSLLTLDPPAAHAIALAAAGDLVAAGADNGLLYGVVGSRAEVAWRVPVGAPIARLTVYRDRLLVITEGNELLGFAAATGEPLFRAELPVDPAGEVLPVPGGWIVAGAGRTGGEVLGLAADGTVRWRVRPNLGAEAPAIRRAGGAVYARGEAGICRIDRGKVRWNEPCLPGGAPVLIRGLLALPGETLRLLDAATGRGLLVTGNTSALPPADHLLATEDVLVVADREGAVAAMRLAGALAVV